MIERGIIDPTKVTRSALQNAASVAALVFAMRSQTFSAHLQAVGVVLLVLMVQAFQSVGTLWATKSDKRLRK